MKGSSERLKAQRYRSAQWLRTARWRGHRLAAWAGVALMGVALVVVAVQGKWHGALTILGFLVASILIIGRKTPFPPLFDLIFILAAAGNACGWVWNLFEMPGPYYEIMHGYTIFAVTLAAGYSCYHSLFEVLRPHRALFMLAIVSFGIAIGALWEIAEWTADLFISATVIPGLDDTITDLILDSAGALCAGLLVLLAFPKDDPPSGSKGSH